MVSILIDEELVLRDWQPDDAAELFKLVDHSRQHLRQWFPWVDMTQKADHSLQFIQQSRSRQRNQEGLTLAIVYNRKIVGSMGMHEWNHQLKKAQIGYWIAEDYQGKGIVHRCLNGFIDFLFNRVGLNKVEIQFMVSNKRSAAVSERLGCKVEGIIRQGYILNGNYHDLVITGLLKTEWKGLPPSASKAFKPV